MKVAIVDAASDRCSHAAPALSDMNCELSEPPSQLHLLRRPVADRAGRTGFLSRTAIFSGLFDFYDFLRPAPGRAPPRLTTGLFGVFATFLFVTFDFLNRIQIHTKKILRECDPER
ncbi:hypothetical protein IVB33_07595 [Bradyrhizobium sp. 24]|uniref:hypothetical protein n=1 Tax=unclassified Bradyrhizobium TaxID=2631580 RepID=UPI001FFB92A0|nr:MULTISPECIES: hypothetical protein [unclassified Bradyrhizobium]MCK1299725.1 hypothetical protein [Bradyrhizobium sp. 37]MCK1378096.1 hypothetical protein [Bradyrhizobium sp. 24]MCK1771559.1 hypothetical protein [Bradyrhizobium sp. 134]